jgi:hypothetical protein
LDDVDPAPGCIQTAEPDLRGRGGISARRAASDHRAQHLRRGHRPARCPDRLVGAVAAGATCLARCRSRPKTAR